MKIVRSILAMVVGSMVAVFAIFAIQKVSGLIYPLPAGITIDDTDKMNEWIATLPIGAFLMVLLSYGIGSFVGGAGAALIAAFARCVHAGIIGGLVLIF